MEPAAIRQGGTAAAVRVSQPPQATPLPRSAALAVFRPCCHSLPDGHHGDAGAPRWGGWVGALSLVGNRRQGIKGSPPDLPHSPLQAITLRPASPPCQSA